MLTQLIATTVALSLCTEVTRFFGTRYVNSRYYSGISSEGRIFRIRILSELRLNLRSAGGSRIKVRFRIRVRYEPAGIYVSRFRDWLPHLAAEDAGILALYPSREPQSSWWRA